MKNILIHHNGGDPVYVALSDEMTFEVVYKGKLISSHNSIGMAIEYACNECIKSGTKGIIDWEVAEKL
ncbi:hypothetical protein [Polynucleobacter sp. es-MAR-4]|uniref:hypothetical protein n=1 Tax=Polynucleobacter sp. es-MAR-4 TaxID=1855655 RepID=UPI001C0E2D7C|nr:hypothetical protein [Polynucleobacter sp. es-MAR-4]MBU3636080.1 hypothetical protein [Polynucleobacter sp. es-MAR-4]